jgi:hypothetical protein
MYHSLSLIRFISSPSRPSRPYKLWDDHIVRADHVKTILELFLFRTSEITYDRVYQATIECDLLFHWELVDCKLSFVVDGYMRKIVVL